MRGTFRRAISISGTVFLAGSLLLLVLQVAEAYPTLPDRMASHFDGSGRANGSSSKTSFHVVWLLTLVFTGALPLSIGRLLRVSPPSLVNLPHKDYWLSTPERTREAGAILRGVLGWMMGPINGILYLVYAEIVSFHRTGRFEFPLAIFLSTVALVVVGGFALPWLALTPTREELAESDARPEGGPPEVWRNRWISGTGRSAEPVDQRNR